MFLGVFKNCFILSALKDIPTSRSIIMTNELLCLDYECMAVLFSVLHVFTVFDIIFNDLLVYF